VTARARPAHTDERLERDLARHRPEAVHDAKPVLADLEPLTPKQAIEAEERERDANGHAHKASDARHGVGHDVSGVSQPDAAPDEEYEHSGNGSDEPSRRGPDTDRSEWQPLRIRMAVFLFRRHCDVDDGFKVSMAPEEPGGRGV
jgi:hypothetical protein